MQMEQQKTPTLFISTGFLISSDTYIQIINDDTIMVDLVQEKMRFFRESQLLPPSKGFDYENWLDNFQDSEDKKIAAHILNFFIYFPDDIINQMLRTAVGRCGYYFSKLDPYWTHDSFKDNCWYSFVQGENPDDATDSGFIFTRKLREQLNIQDERILKYEGLFKKLEDNATVPQNVILVDDFVGTGAQTDDAWNKHRYGKYSRTLSEHERLFHHRIVYAPLVVNELGLSRIECNCPNLHLEYIHKLGREYNLLDVDGLCWKGDKAMHSKFLDLLSRVATQEGIPNKNGCHVNDILGFGKQCLALAFSHGIPDACSAFFYWETATWKPLKKRPYHR